MTSFCVFGGRFFELGFLFYRLTSTDLPEGDMYVYTIYIVSCVQNRQNTLPTRRLGQRVWMHIQLNLITSPRQLGRYSHS